MAIATRAPEIDFARDLELRTAERDRAVALLDALYAVVDRDGGFRSHEDQQAIADVRVFLEEAGLKTVTSRPIWTDRS